MKQSIVDDAIRLHIVGQQQIDTMKTENATLRAENERLRAAIATVPDLLTACEVSAEWLRHFLHHAHSPSLGNPNIEKLENDLIILKTILDKAKGAE